MQWRIKMYFGAPFLVAFSNLLVFKQHYKILHNRKGKEQ
jgi:hypothetical protein